MTVWFIWQKAVRQPKFKWCKTEQSWEFTGASHKLNRACTWKREREKERSQVWWLRIDLVVQNEGSKIDRTGRINAFPSWRVTLTSQQNNYVTKARQKTATHFRFNWVWPHHMRASEQASGHGASPHSTSAAECNKYVHHSWLPSLYTFKTTLFWIYWVNRPPNIGEKLSVNVVNFEIVNQINRHRTRERSPVKQCHLDKRQKMRKGQESLTANGKEPGGKESVRCCAGSNFTKKIE